MITDRQTGIETGLAMKAPVLAASTANVTLSGTTQAIDGVTPSTGDRVLLTNQTAATDNGIWTVQSSSWIRAQDFDGSRDVTRGTAVYVVAGTNNSSHVFFVNSTGNNIPGTDSITFAQSRTLSISSAVSPSTFMADFLVLTSGATASNYLGAAIINQTGVNSSASIFLELESTSSSTNANPFFSTFRNSTAPVADALLGFFRFEGNDASITKVNYGTIRGRIDDPSSSTGAGGLSVLSRIDSTLSRVVRFGSGLVVASSGSTVSDKGFGTVNSSAGFYLNDQLIGQTFRASYETTSGANGQVVPNVAWNLMTVNTVSGATSGWALGSNLLTPPPGVWDIEAWCVVPSSAAGRRAAARIYDNTAASVVARGPTVFGASEMIAGVSGRYSANGTNQIEIDVYTGTSSTVATQTALNTGANETYLQFKAVRVG